MNRRIFLKASGALSLLLPSPRRLFASPTIRRVRPSDPGWPTKEAWKRLNDAIGGNLIPVDFPINACLSSSESADCKALFANPSPRSGQVLAARGWFLWLAMYAIASHILHGAGAGQSSAAQDGCRIPPDKRRREVYASVDSALRGRSGKRRSSKRRHACVTRESRKTPQEKRGIARSISGCEFCSGRVSCARLRR